MINTKCVIGWLGFAMAAVLLLEGCGSRKVDNTVYTEDTEDTEAIRDIFAMDTYMTVSAYGGDAKKAVDLAVDEIERLDSILSTGNENSEIYRINQESGGTVSEDTAYLIERSLELYETTGGIFDIAIYPVMKAWGFTDQNYRVPSADELNGLLALTDVGQIRYEKQTAEISFGKDGMQIDLGGIAKGYTSGRIMDIFRECNVKSGLVNLGGNVQAYGTKQDGSKWRVAIQDPEDENDYIGILSIEDEAVITSGGYERYFEQDGINYHHIIDPQTGYPADSGVISATIISVDGTLADGLSTSMFIMGVKQAEEYWKEYSDKFDMILMTDDRELYITEGIVDDFETDNRVHIIKGNE